MQKKNFVLLNLKTTTTKTTSTTTKRVETTKKKEFKEINAVSVYCFLI